MKLSSSSQQSPPKLPQRPFPFYSGHNGTSRYKPTLPGPSLTPPTDSSQIAIAKFFDGETADPVAEALAAQAAAPPPAAARTTSRTLATPPNALTRNRSGITPAPRIVPQPTSVSRRPPFLLALLIFPFSMLWRVGNSFLTLFYTLFPFLARFRPATRTARARRSQTPRDTAARFIRLFEEEYGADTGLPFFEGGYAQALELAKKELRFLLVVLQSDEHDDTTSFNRDTLTNPEVVRFINDHRIILWAGSVQDSEAYQVSTALACTKFPFAALIAMTPASGSNSQGMSVVTRCAGPTLPAALITKMTTAINTHAESLDRLRAQRAVHEADRAIREQQNSAYEASLAADRERARARKEAAEAAAREAEAARKAAEEAEALERNREAWRKWRASLLPEEPEAGPETARVSIRMGDGERLVRRFGAGADVEEVYAFVDCLGVELDEKVVAPPEGYAHEWGFRLVSLMPRQVLEAQGKVRDGMLWPSANLVVESLADDSDDDDE